MFENKDTILFTETGFFSIYFSPFVYHVKSLFSLHYHCLFSKVCKEAFGLTEDQHANEFKFMRKGKAGDWKNHFDQETQRKFQNWEHKWLNGTDLEFCYEV